MLLSDSVLCEIHVLEVYELIMSPFFASSYQTPCHVIYMIMVLKVYELIISPSFCEPLSERPPCHIYMITNQLLLSHKEQLH